MTIGSYHHSYLIEMDTQPDPPKIILCRGRGGRFLTYIMPNSCGLRGECGRLVPDQTPCSAQRVATRCDHVWLLHTIRQNIGQSSRAHMSRHTILSSAPPLLVTGAGVWYYRAGVHQVGKVLSPFQKLWHYIKTPGLWHSPWSLLQWGSGDISHHDSTPSRQPLGEQTYWTVRVYHI